MSQKIIWTTALSIVNWKNSAISLHQYNFIALRQECVIMKPILMRFDISQDKNWQQIKSDGWRLKKLENCPRKPSLFRIQYNPVLMYAIYWMATVMAYVHIRSEVYWAWFNLWRNVLNMNTFFSFNSAQLQDKKKTKKYESSKAKIKIKKTQMVRFEKKHNM